jgi:hypothetical protein
LPATTPRHTQDGDLGALDRTVTIALISCAPAGELLLEDAGVVPPPNKAKQRKVEFRWTRALALQHFHEQSVPIDGFVSYRATFHFEIPCEGELGNETVLKQTLRQSPRSTASDY